MDVGSSDVVKAILGSSPIAFILAIYFARTQKRKLSKEADKAGVDAAAVLSGEALEWIREARQMVDEANDRYDALEKRMQNCEEELRKTKDRLRRVESDKAHLLRLVRALVKYIHRLHNAMAVASIAHPEAPEVVVAALEEYSHE